MNGRRRRIPVGRLSLVAALAAAAISIWSSAVINLSPARLRPQLIDQISALTGQVADIRGPVEFEIWPRPHIVISELSLYSPSAYSDAEMLAVPRVVVDVDLVALGLGLPAVRKLTFEQPRLNIRRNGYGDWNWARPLESIFGRPPALKQSFVELVMTAATVNVVLEDEGAAYEYFVWDFSARRMANDMLWHITVDEASGDEAWRIETRMPLAPLMANTVDVPSFSAVSSDSQVSGSLFARFTEDAPRSRCAAFGRPLTDREANRVLDPG